MVAYQAQINSKLEICELQSLVKQRQRARSRKKQKQAITLLCINRSFFFLLKNKTKQYREKKEGKREKNSDFNQD